MTLDSPLGNRFRRIFLAACLACSACADPLPSGFVSFEEVTSKAGIEYEGTSYGSAWGDVNGDGYPDLWVFGHNPPRLLVNRRDGSFTDRTSNIIESPVKRDWHAAAWADFDNDGDQDILQLAGGARGKRARSNALYVNDRGRLLDRAAEFDITYGTLRGRTPVWLDADSDGRLDAILTGAEHADAPSSLFSWRGSKFIQTPMEYLAGAEFAQLTMLQREFKANVIAPSTGGFIRVGGPQKESNSSSRLSRLFSRSRGYVNDIVVGDLDADLLPDLALARGFLWPGVEQTDQKSIRARLDAKNRTSVQISFRSSGDIELAVKPVSEIWWHRGNVFIGSTGKPPAAFPIQLSASDSALGQLAPGDNGLFIAYDPESSIWQIELRSEKWTTASLEITSTEPIVELESANLPDPKPFHQLIKWNSDGSGEAEESILDGAFQCFGAGLADFDNDMDLDLYFTCGDSISNRRNQLYENLGERQFRRIESNVGLWGSEAGIGESVAVADYDLDGFLDVFVRNGKASAPFGVGPDQLFRNLGNGNHWVEIDLVGTISNRDAIGARVVLTAGGVQQLRVVDNGTHGRVQDFRRLHFGLGSNDSIEKIIVEWPSGEITEFKDIAADRVIVLKENGALSFLATPLAGYETIPY